MDDWERELDAADAELRGREHAALQDEVTEQELQAFAAERDKLATDRDSLAEARDVRAGERDVAALTRDVDGSNRDRAARSRTDDEDVAAVDRFLAGSDRDLAAGDRSDSVDDRRRSAQARRGAAENRQRAADDRRAAATRDDAAQREISGLQEALESRLQIGRAEGLLMARYDLDPDAAFALLVRHSQHAHIKLRDVAARLVDDATGHADSNTEQPDAAETTGAD